MQGTETHPRGARQFVGTAIIAGASYGPKSTVLQLVTCTGEYVAYTVEDVPDHASAEELQRSGLPLSVKIQESGKQCWAMALTSAGPRRKEVTLGAALALQQAGVHAVVDGGLQAHVPCSAHSAPVH